MGWPTPLPHRRRTEFSPPPYERPARPRRLEVNGRTQEVLEQRSGPEEKVKTLLVP